MLVSGKRDIFNQLIQDATRDELLWMNGFLAGIISSNSNADTAVNFSAGLIEQASVKVDKLTILFATETGNAKSLATKFAGNTKKQGIKTKLASVEQYRLSDLSKEEYLFLVTSTQGDGEPPLGAVKFFQALQDESLRLPKLKYAVLALGDSSYPLFCQAGEDADKLLELRGAKRAITLQKCDTDYDNIADQWLEDALKSLEHKTTSVTAPTNHFATSKSSGKKIIHGSIITNFNLNDKDSNKRTHHIEIEAEGVIYEPGDAIGILPENPAGVVNEIINLVEMTPDTEVIWKEQGYALKDLLLKKLQIIYLHERTVKKYASIIGQEIPETKINLVDLLKIYPVKNEEEFLKVLQILEANIPRLYSISSSPEAHPDEVHITVAKDNFWVNEKQESGLCSSYLIDLPEGANIEFYVHSNKIFKLPDASSPVIMIGPGTGIAPFRSFLFERDARGADGKNWLFFGDQHFTSDFLYQTEIQTFLETGTLTTFNGAFSRDQKNKIYVQHKMLERETQLFEWLESGAYIYVCGSKDPMSFDIDKTLLDIIGRNKQVNEEHALAYLDNLKETGRYVKDVY